MQISIANLVKRYGATVAVDGISFEVNQGEIFGLLGSNGAGKTTTLECLAGLRKPDSGELRVVGEDPVRHARAVSERIGTVLQRTELPERLTPREALVLFGSFYRRRADPDQLLGRYKLREKAHAPYNTLSGGQRQRLALALAFVNEPELVLLDEPAAGLDPQAREELHAHLLALRSGGQTVLLSTHDLEEAERLCDRVAVLHQGRLIAIVAPGDLRPRGRGRVQVIRLRSRPAADREQLVNLAGVQSVGQEGGAWLLETDNVAATMVALGTLVGAMRAEVLELQAVAPTLQQVYFDITSVAERGTSP